MQIAVRRVHFDDVEAGVERARAAASRNAATTPAMSAAVSARGTG